MRYLKKLCVTSSACAMLLLVSCGTTEQESAIAVENCGETVTFAAVPERVTLLKNASVSTLEELDVLDQVTAKAGTYPQEYYAEDLAQRVDEIPQLTDRMDASGHLLISREAVISTEPDLVIGQTDTINRETMAASEIPLIEEPAFCDAIEGSVTWDDVFDQVRLYGTIFDKNGEAESVVEDLRTRIDENTSDLGEGKTVAVLYPTIGGGITYAYGTGSMSNPLVESTGLENVFGSETDRVFEVSAEEIVGRNPDVILALYTEGEADAIMGAVQDLPGAASITAVREGHILPMLLNFAEPPTPSAVDGLEKLNAYLGTLQ